MASLEFDKQVNALYLRLRKGKIFSSEPLADNIIIDLDEKKKVLGLEPLLSSTIEKEIKAQDTSRRQARPPLVAHEPTSNSPTT